MDELTAQRMIELLPRLRRFALGLCGNRDDADDLVQVACERAIANIRSWRPGTRLDSWMFAITRNAYLDHYRSRAVRAGHRAEARHVGERQFDGVRAAEASITLTRVLALLDRAPEEQRSALLLALVEGLSYEEIAEIQAVPVGTVTSRIGRARQALRAVLAEAGPGEGDETRANAHQ